MLGEAITAKHNVRTNSGYFAARKTSVSVNSSVRTTISVIRCSTADTACSLSGSVDRNESEARASRNATRGQL